MLLSESQGGVRLYSRLEDLELSASEIHPLDARQRFRLGVALAKLGLFDNNLGRLPILVYNGTVEIGQSKTIERFLARQFGFAGDNIIEEALIDTICENIRDIKQKYMDCRIG